MYNGSFKDKQLFRWTWTTLLKYLLYKLWLARNRTIFNQAIENLMVVVNKEKNLMMEAMHSKVIFTQNKKKKLDNEERD
jgi:hypothetical protein